MTIYEKNVFDNVQVEAWNKTVIVDTNVCFITFLTIYTPENLGQPELIVSFCLV